MKFLGPPSSGSNAGTTWSHNKGGQYTRNRRTPTNPNTVKQQLARSVLAYLSRYWATLTSTQQQTWRDWASVNLVVDSLGQAIPMSGHQAFIQLNARLLQAGGTLSTTPPSTPDPVALTSLTITATAPATISAAFAPTPMAANTRVVLWQTLPGSPGRDPNFAQARVVGYSATAQATPYAPTSPYPGVAGNVSNFFASVLDPNGRISPPILYKATYV